MIAPQPKLVQLGISFGDAGIPVHLSSVMYLEFSEVHDVSTPVLRTTVDVLHHHVDHGTLSVPFKEPLMWSFLVAFDSLFLHLELGLTHHSAC